MGAVVENRESKGQKKNLKRLRSSFCDVEYHNVTVLLSCILLNGHTVLTVYPLIFKTTLCCVTF